MAKIITFCIEKGGTGKTTTVASLGSYLAMQGEKVLLLDLDPQGNLSQSLLPSEPEETIVDTFESNGKELPITPISENLDIVPSYSALASVGNKTPIDTIKRAIEPIKEKYNYILLDCPPNLGILTYNALNASTEYYIPLLAETLPYKGLREMLQFAEAIRSKSNTKLSLSGIILTRWEGTSLNKNIENLLRKQYGNKVLHTRIRKNTSLAEAPLSCSNIFQWAPNSNGSKDYKELAREMFSIDKI